MIGFAPRPGVANSARVRTALNQLEKIDIVVPVWDRTTGQGSNARYRVVGFASVRLVDYRLPGGGNTITARFLGDASCGAVAQPTGFGRTQRFR